LRYAILVSWSLWGLSLYLFSPYLSPLLEQIVHNAELVGIIYVIASPFSILFSLLPKWFNKANSLLIPLSLTISGIGLLTLGLSENQALAILGLILYNFYWASVPLYYVLMSILGDGCLTRIWAISMIPAIIVPPISGLVFSKLGIRMIFVISGLTMITASLPMYKIEAKLKEEGKGETSYLPLIFTILPSSIALPFLYLDKGISESLIWLIYAIGEGLGVGMSLVLWRLKNGLSLALIVFSGIITAILYPQLGGVFYGSSEALVALGVDAVKPRDLNNAVKVTFIESTLWGVGYVIASLLYVVWASLPIIFAGLIAILFSLTLIVLSLKIFVRKLYLGKIKSLNKLIEKQTLYEGIEPYFSFA